MARIERSLFSIQTSTANMLNETDIFNISRLLCMRKSAGEPEKGLSMTQLRVIDRPSIYRIRARRLRKNKLINNNAILQASRINPL